MRTGADTALRDALLDSRGRWRDLVAMAADLAFETDADGRLVFISPDPAIGWAASALIGQPAEMLLLADADGGSGFNPFRPPRHLRRRRAWLRRPDGSSICLAFAAAPLLDAQGSCIGARGVGQDTTEQRTTTTPRWRRRCAASSCSTICSTGCVRRCSPRA